MPLRPLDTIRMADLKIDLLRHRASRAGQRLDLTSKEFLLLSLLARRAGEALSRTLIAEAVWDMNFDCDTNVVDIKSLSRQKKQRATHLPAISCG
jgi:two-component system copper resistance phosphate regulon response regulator CusR